MNANLLRSQGLLAVAVGAGVVIGAAGVFLYEHLIKEKRRLILQQDVTKLGISVSELRRELQEIRDAQKKSRRSRNRSVGNTSSSVLHDGDSEVMSIPDDDMDEFYDLSDDEVIPEIEKIENEIKSKFKDVDSSLNGSPEEINKCFGILLELHAQDENNPDILWRLAHCCHSMSVVKGDAGDVERKKDYLNKGLEYATRCLEVAPRSADAHKWYAICIGGRSSFLTISDRIKDGLQFKNHVEEALTLTPNDSTLHHLLGRYFFEAASLSWIERKLALTLFGEVPYGSFVEAADALRKAEEFSEKPWKENMVLLARCYIHEKEYPEAMGWLDRAIQVEPVSKEDFKADVEIKELMRQYEHYRL